MVTVWLAAAIVAAPPPLKGRPDDFCGGVGSFELSAEIQPSKFRLDETATLTVRLKGAGDLADFRTPDLTKQKSFADRFDVVGPPKQSDANDGVRIDFPIRARSTAGKSVPSIRFSIYDDRSPRPGYRLLRSAEIPIEVQQAPVNEIATASPTEESTPPSLGSWTPPAIVAFAILFAIAIARISPLLRGSSLAQPAGGGKVLAKSRRRRTSEPPAGFTRSDADRWIDRFGEALKLPKGRWTSQDIVAATRAIRIDQTLLDSLAGNLAGLDARRFGGPDSSAANDAEFTAAFDAVLQTKLAPTA